MTKIVKLLFVFLVLLAHQELRAYASSDLPILKITTENSRQIVRESRISAEIGIIYNGPGQRNNLSDPAGHFQGKAEIRTRGNSTAGWPKKPYDFKIVDDSGANMKVALLGMAEHADWILLASYLDHTFIRTPLAKHMSMLQGRWASSSRMVEVYLNGNYQGIYILIEKIKRSKRRLGVEKLAPDEVEYPEITGGYIYEISGQKNNLGETRELDYPDFDKAAPEQIAYIKQYDDNFRNAMRSENYANLYHKWIDDDSFVDELIVQEAMRNSDAYGWSAYFHKRRNDRINAGPVWDFDQSAGNSSYPDDAVASGWLYAHHLTNNTPFFWKLLMNDPAFKYKVRLRWEKLRESEYKTENLFGYIDSIAQSLSEAQVREFKKWPVLGVNFWRETSGYESRNTYRKEVDYLKNFLSRRWEWMDQELAKVSEPGSAGITPPDTVSGGILVFPNPATDQITFLLSSEHDDEAAVTIYCSSGMQVINSATEILNAGLNYIPVGLEGFGPGVYFYSLKFTHRKESRGKFVIIN